MRQKILAVKADLKSHTHAKLHKAVHGSHTFFHCIYLAAVSIEAHGFYGKAAMGLLAVMFIGMLTGDSE